MIFIITIFNYQGNSQNWVENNITEYFNSKLDINNQFIRNTTVDSNILWINSFSQGLVKYEDSVFTHYFLDNYSKGYIHNFVTNKQDIFNFDKVLYGNQCLVLYKNKISKKGETSLLKIKNDTVYNYNKQLKKMGLIVDAQINCEKKLWLHIRKNDISSYKDVIFYESDNQFIVFNDIDTVNNGDYSLERFYIHNNYYYFVLKIFSNNVYKYELLVFENDKYKKRINLLNINNSNSSIVFSFIKHDKNLELISSNGRLFKIYNEQIEYVSLPLTELGECFGATYLKNILYCSTSNNESLIYKIDSSYNIIGYIKPLNAQTILPYFSYNEMNSYLDMIICISNGCIPETISKIRILK